MLVRKEGTWKANSVENAVAAAAKELGLSETELQVEVVQEPQKKTFGLFGGSDAVVRVSYEVPDDAEETAAEAVSEEKPCCKECCSSESVEEAKTYLAGMLKAMGIEETVITVDVNEEGCQMTLQSEQEGMIIGRRGETLDALQYLTSLVLNRKKKDYCRLTLQVGNYREKREKSLIGLAKKHANQAARTGRRISLEPMNPYERRVIHTAVQDVKGATSWSEGKDPNRHVIIGPSEDNRVARNRRKPNSRGEKGNRGEKKEVYDSTDVYMRYAGSIGSDRPMREFVSRSNPLPDAVDAEAPVEKTVSATESESDIKLYGRIDL